MRDGLTILRLFIGAIRSRQISFHQPVLHDGVAVLLGKLCHWGVAISIVHPRYEVVIRLFAVITCSPEVIGQHLRLLIGAVVPLVQEGVAASNKMSS